MEIRYTMFALATMTIIISGLSPPYSTSLRLLNWACQSHGCGLSEFPKTSRIGMTSASSIGA